MRAQPHQELLLDTTVQIDRLTEKPVRVRHIEERVGGRTMCTCSLVLRQFKRNVIRGCISLLDIIDRNDTAADVDSDIAGHFTQTSIVLKIKAQLVRECNPAGTFDKELWMEALKGYVEGGLVARFWTGVERKADCASCELAREEVVRKDRPPYFAIATTCARERANCGLPTLYQMRASAAEMLRNAAEDARDSKKRRFLSDLLASWQAAVETHGSDGVKGQVACGALSDLTIALEAEAGETLMSTDHHHDMICAALGSPCERIQYPAERRAA